MGKNLLAVDDFNFETEVLASKEPVLLDFTATWCGPCKMLKPIVEAIADENVGKYKVATIDIDASPATSARYGVRGAPTVVVFVDGKEAGRHLGVTSKERLLSLLRRTAA